MMLRGALVGASIFLAGCFDLTLNSPCESTADCPGGQVCSINRRCMVVAPDLGPERGLKLVDLGPASDATGAEAGCGQDGPPCKNGDSKPGQ